VQVPFPNIEEVDDTHIIVAGKPRENERVLDKDDVSVRVVHVELEVLVWLTAMAKRVDALRFEFTIDILGACKIHRVVVP
jgi:hypothetical protein